MGLPLSVLLVSRPASFLHARPTSVLATLRMLTTTVPNSKIDKNHPCHLNHAGASPSPQSVLDRVQQHMELEQQIGGYAAQEIKAAEMEAVYNNVAELIQARSSLEIALMESATTAWTRIFYAMAQKQLRDNRGDVILTCDAEYAANLVAAAQWARDHEWTVLSIPSTQVEANEDSSSGIVDLEVLEDMLGGKYSYRDERGALQTLHPSRVAMVCITHVPTNSGIVNPVSSIGRMISEYNQNESAEVDGGDFPILFLVDACQSVGQLAINVQEMQCHALVATGRKFLRAPRGTGFLYVATHASNIMPSHVDHYGVPVTKVPTEYCDGDAVDSMLEFVPRNGARRFEFWESNTGNRLGLGAAIQHAIGVGPTKIERQCRQLAKRLRDRLSQIPTVMVHHDSSTSCGIVTFYSTRADSKSIKASMQEQGYGLSLVPATSTPLDSARTKVPDLTRASVHYTNTAEEIDEFSLTLAAFLGSVSSS